MNPVSYTQILKETALRRQIPAEMQPIRQAIQKIGFADPITQLIHGWQGRFMHAFRSSPHEQKVVRKHAYLLQQILLLSEAPSNAAVRQAVSWLERRGASRRDMGVPDEERVARLVRARDARRQEESKEISGRLATFDRQFAQRIAQNGAQIQRMLAPFRQATNRSQQQLEVVDAIGQRDQMAMRELSERVQNSVENAQNDLSQMSQELDEVNASMDGELARVQNTLQTIREDDQESFQTMRSGIESLVRQNFNPIREQIASDQQSALAQLNALHVQYQHQMEPLREKVASLRKDVVQLEEGNRELQQTLAVTSAQLDQIDRREKALREGIKETRIAIQKVREKEKPKWYATALKIGACALVNWALPVDGVFFPDGQGFVFRTIINL